MDKSPSPATSDMKEKYFHSLGALLCDEGRLDEAIEAFRSAIGLKDTAYARYDLGRTYLEKGDLEKAVIELSRAIELHPSAPEYWHERGLVRQRMGDHDRASADLAEAKRIDPYYGRIDEIRSAVRAIERGLCDPEMEEFCDTTSPGDPELCAIVDGIRESLQLNRDVMDKSSCPVATCPVYCCHFTEATVCHGLTIGAWKLHSIRAFLKENGLDPNDFIDRLPFRGEEHLRSLVPPHYILKEGESRFIFHPKRSDRFVVKADLADLPKGRHCQTLMWINEKAQPCAFLHEKRCMIHDTGDEPSLEACKQFLCLTGFVFVILGHLGILNESAIPDKPMAELNRLAIESALILGRTLYCNEDLTDLSKEMHHVIKAAVAADKTGNTKSLRKRVAECRKLKTKHDRIASNLRQSAAEEIRKKLDSGSSPE